WVDARPASAIAASLRHVDDGGQLFDRRQAPVAVAGETARRGRSVRGRPAVQRAEKRAERRAVRRMRVRWLWGAGRPAERVRVAVKARTGRVLLLPHQSRVEGGHRAVDVLEVLARRRYLTIGVH